MVLCAQGHLIGTKRKAVRIGVYLDLSVLAPNFFVNYLTEDTKFQFKNHRCADVEIIQTV